MISLFLLVHSGEVASLSPRLSHSGNCGFYRKINLVVHKGHQPESGTHGLNTGLVFALSRVRGFLIWLMPSRNPGLGPSVLLRQESAGKGI